MVATTTQVPADPLRDLTAYELRNLVAHLTEAGRLGALRGLLTLESAEGRNAWYEAKVRSGAFGAYALDVAAALRAVQEQPLCFDGDSPHVPHLGEEYRHSLMLTSLNSLSARLEPSLTAGLARTGLTSTTDALSYARRGTDAFSRAKALIGLLPALDESERRGVSQEILREVTASESAGQAQRKSDYAKLLASVVPYVTASDAQPIVESLIDQLAVADRVREDEFGWNSIDGYIDAVIAVSGHLTTRQARRLFRVASRSDNERARDALLPAIAASADGRLLRRVLRAAEKSRSPARARILVDIAPYLAPAARERVLEMAMVSAIESNRPDQVATMLRVSRGHQRDRVLRALIEAARMHTDPETHAVGLLQAAMHVDGLPEREALVDEALHIAETLADHPYPYRLARFVSQLPQPAKGRLLAIVLAAARRMSGDDEDRLWALAELAALADEGDREAVEAEALTAFQQTDPIRQSVAIQQLAPHVPLPILREAHRISQVISDDDHQRDALAALEPYLLCSPTDEELTAAIAAARAVRHEQIGSDILVALAGRLSGAHRAFVLDAALTHVQADNSTSVHRGIRLTMASWGIVALAPNLDYVTTPDVRPVWERAVGIAMALGKAPDRAHALAALGAVCGPDAPEAQPVRADALAAARVAGHWSRAGPAIVLASLGRQVAEADRAELLEEASVAAWLVIKHARTARRFGGLLAGPALPQVEAAAVVAAALGAVKGRALARAVVKEARRLPEDQSSAKIDALLTVMACYEEPRRSRLLREALAAARKRGPHDLAGLTPVLDEPDRSAALSEVLPQARRHDGYDTWSPIASALAAMPPEAAYTVLHNPPDGLTTLPRDNLLIEITHMAPLILAIGGRAAVAEVATAIRQSARWWP
jgi:hypothetical protein